MTAFILVIFVALLLGTAFGVAMRKLVIPSTVSECDPEWVNSFSVAKYRPMLRLLNEQDHEFLKTQPGYEAKTWRALRSERRRIFRVYLRNLVCDYHKLHMAARMAIVYSDRDRPELATMLVQQRLAFTKTVALVQLRLVLHTLGLGPVDVKGLLGALDAMSVNVRELNSATVAAG